MLKMRVCRFRLKYVFLILMMTLLVPYIILKIDNGKKPVFNLENIMQNYSKKWIIVDCLNEKMKNIEKIANENKNYAIIVYNYADKTRNYQKLQNVLLLNRTLADYCYGHFGIQRSYEDDHNIAYLLAAKFFVQSVVEVNHNVQFKVDVFERDKMLNALVVEANGDGFNPLPHFGQSCASPKGVLQSTNDRSKTPRKYFLKSMTTPQIQYLITKQDIQYESEMKVSQNQFKLDPVAPPVVVPRGTFSPFIPTVKMIKYGAFWTQFRFQNSKIQGVYRSVVEQKLLWQQNGSLMFIGDNSVTVDAGYNNEGTKNSVRSSQIIQNLSMKDKFNNIASRTSWNSIAGFATQILETLAFRNILPSRQIDCFKLWINALKNIEYNIENINENYFEITLGKKLTVYSSEQSSVTVGGQIVCQEEKQYHDQLNKMKVKELCGKEMNANVSNFHNFDDVLVLISLSNNLENTLYINNMLYRRAIPNLILCNLHDFESKAVHELKLSFIPSEAIELKIRTENRQSLQTDCMAIAMSMGYRVNGYLMIQDDTFVHYWNWKKQQEHKDFGWRIMDEYITDVKHQHAVSTNGKYLSDHQNWYNRDYTKNMTTVLGIVNAPKTEPLRQCKMNRDKILSSPTMYYSAQIDVFYIPKQLAYTFSSVMIEFIKTVIWPEIAIPTIYRCIVPNDKSITIPFGHDYTSKNAVIYKNYKNLKNKHYVHPMKFNSAYKNTDDGKSRRKVFCEEILPEFLNH